MDLTYKIIGADTHEYGPVSLLELKKWVSEGRITGATQVSRSDQEGWSTAGSFPELGVRDSTGPALTATSSAADPLSERQLKNGGSWFYWIAGLSLINSAVALSGSQRGFTLIVGLEFTQIIDEIAHEIGSGAGFAVAIGLDLLVAGMFIFFGIFANKRRAWSFIAGMAFYALDGLIYLIDLKFLAVGFHAFVLWCIFRGFKACQQLNAGS